MAEACGGGLRCSSSRRCPIRVFADGTGWRSRSTTPGIESLFVETVDCPATLDICESRSLGQRRDEYVQSNILVPQSHSQSHAECQTPELELWLVLSFVEQVEALLPLQCRTQISHSLFVFVTFCNSDGLVWQKYTTKVHLAYQRSQRPSNGRRLWSQS